MKEECGFERVNNPQLQKELDQQFPQAGSRAECEYQGRVYRKRFLPAVKQGPVLRPCGKLGGGKVTSWDTYWEEKKPIAALSTVEAKLDHRFPNARSKEEVVFEGKRYRRAFIPVLSRSGKTIHRWESAWICLSEH